ncbi:hypothetical protein [Bifidobacterium platyrrhinorum]|uniref:hypothetical protein n=1 Tax=Bifidobacterium platyrrhinorum TaxID=2661628 RepID=UPI0013D891E3|nr:hypothetical protein [Bifidobacterium platyrrhinorum]
MTTRRPRRWVRMVGAVACVACSLSLAACTPQGAAVGDTQDYAPRVAHTGTVRDDVVIGLVGSKQATADGPVLDALSDADLETAYVSVKDSGGSGSSEAAAVAAHAQQQGVRDMVSRVVSLVVVADIDATADKDGWDSALRDAREAGIPVVLLSPVHAPADARLYAGTFTVNDRAADATPVDDAVMAVVNDEPHAREIMVSTVR